MMIIGCTCFNRFLSIDTFSRKNPKSSWQLEIHFSCFGQLYHNFLAAAPEEVTGYYPVYGNCGSNDIQNISPGSVQGCAPVCEKNTACIGKRSIKYLGDVQ